jgi:hypothetical protein
MTEDAFWESLGTGGKAVSVEELKRLAMARRIEPDDVRYLLSRYPFLDICNAQATMPEVSVPAEMITALSQWKIHDRGDRLTTGPGRLIYGAYHPLKEEEEEGGSEGTELVMPDGTLSKQQFDTAVELILLAQQRWPAVAIVDGYYAMQRAAWMAAESLGIAINFQPNSDDLRIFEKIKQNGGVKFPREAPGQRRPKPKVR